MLSGQAERECGLFPPALLEVAAHRVSLRRRPLLVRLRQQVLEPLAIPDGRASLGLSRLQVVAESLTPMGGGVKAFCYLRGATILNLLESQGFGDRVHGLGGGQVQWALGR